MYHRPKHVIRIHIRIHTLHTCRTLTVYHLEYDVYNYVLSFRQKSGGTTSSRRRRKTRYRPRQNSFFLFFPPRFGDTESVNLTRYRYGGVKIILFCVAATAECRTPVTRRSRQRNETVSSAPQEVATVSHCFVPYGIQNSGAGPL